MKKMKTMKVSALPILLLLGLMNQCTHSTEPKHTGPDTTSHNFIWTLDTLGAEGSIARDIAVIDENNIWVVGKFYKTPYGSNDHDTLYNAMQWNGVKWTLKSIIINNFSGSQTATLLSGIISFGNEEFWVTSQSGSWGRWKKGSWSSEVMPIGSAQGTVTRIWGRNSEDIYFGGTNGSLTHWNGVEFKKIETGTNSTLQDLADTTSGVFFNTHFTLFNLSSKGLSHSAFPVNISPINTIHAFKENNKYIVYISGQNGIFMKNNDGWNDQFDLSSNDISGDKTNFIVGVGNFFKIAFYNGIRWKELDGSWIIVRSKVGSWDRVKVRGNAFYTVGYQSSYSFYLKGKNQ